MPGRSLPYYILRGRPVSAFRKHFRSRLRANYAFKGGQKFLVVSMSRRSSSTEPPLATKNRRIRASSLHHPPMSAGTPPKRTLTSPPGNGAVFEKRQSSAELMLQRLKQKFKPMNRQASNPNCTAGLHSGFATPGRHHGGYPVQSKREERSRSLNAVYATTSPHPGIGRPESEDDFDSVASWRMYGRRCEHHLVSPTHEWAPSYEEDELSAADEENVMEVQKQIYRAKSEAKTVSVVNGCLYINYQYVCPLPPGCVV